MKKAFLRVAASLTVMAVAFVSTPITGECSKIWGVPGLGVDRISFNSVYTAQEDKSIIAAANALYHDRTYHDLPAEGRAIAQNSVIEGVAGCRLEYNYATTPDAVAYVVDTGLFVENIATLKAEGKLPAYYEYRPLDKYPKAGKEELQKLIDSGIDLSPVFDALYALYGNDNHAYVVHYLTKGKDEGRICVYSPEEYKGCFGDAFYTPEKEAKVVEECIKSKQKYLEWVNSLPK